MIRRLGLPRTSIQELLITRTARSCLAPVPGRPGRYRLGVRSYQLGSRYAEQRDLAAEGRGTAREVADTCGETVRLAALSISVPVNRWSEEREHELTALAAEGAAGLSLRLGHGNAR
ncbi:hypothetical protein ACF05T_27145 [Streptomyces lateritius]|uniref:IclR-ED domain-containing protein n=1 Tax=Streptomyces lateritius TaxID=67313 RepID=A0ABW6YIP6_9ACTN